MTPTSSVLYFMNVRILLLLFLALLARPVAGRAAETLPPDVPSAFRSAVRQHLLATLAVQLQAGGGVKMCFEPYHGVRLLTGRTTVRLLSISGENGYLDKILAAAKVPLAPRKK